MHLEGTPQEFAALLLELQNPQIEILDDDIVRTTKRICVFDTPLGTGAAKTDYVPKKRREGGL